MGISRIKIGRIARASGVPAPRVLSATIATNGLSMTVVFNRAMTGMSGTGEFIGRRAGFPKNLTYSSGDGTATIVFTHTVYTAAGGAITLECISDDVTDTLGSRLSRFTGFAVTNNSTA